MFENLAVVQKIISETELEVYTLDTKETKVLNASREYILGIEEMIYEGEIIVVYYDKETNKVDEDKEEI